METPPFVLTPDRLATDVRRSTDFEKTLPLKCLAAQADPDKAGAAISVEIPPEMSTEVDIGEGDRIRYLDMGELPTSTGSPCAFVDFVRTVPGAWLAALYAIVVIAVARWRGFRALLGLLGAYAVMAHFTLPWPPAHRS